MIKLLNKLNSNKDLKRLPFYFLFKPTVLPIRKDFQLTNF